VFLTASSTRPVEGELRLTARGPAVPTRIEERVKESKRQRIPVPSPGEGGGLHSAANDTKKCSFQSERRFVAIRHGMRGGCVVIVAGAAWLKEAEAGDVWKWFEN
jgi:hypothetical protein